MKSFAICQPGSVRTLFLLILIIGGVVPVLGEEVSGPLSPEETLKTFVVPDDLEVTLFASEPNLKNPTCFDIDSRGRAWVAEGVNYRGYRGLIPEGDRIVILEDTDGDGKADSEKTYYQGTDIDCSLGLCVAGNQVIVSCAPQVLVFTDEDGDDHPDRKEVLFQGISGEQDDHSVHSAMIGPDGKIYFNMGNHGKQIFTPEGKPVIDLDGNPVNDTRHPYQQGMVFRCNLDGSEFETLAWNFRNNYEVTVDSFGTVWQSDNDDDGNKGVRINYVMPFGNYGYKGELHGENWRTARINREKTIPRRHWFQNDPGVVPNLLQTGWGSPAGIAVYEGNLLPQRFRDQIVHCDAGPRVVRAYPVEKKGAGYQAAIANLFQASDTWCRPVDVCVAPDGSLLVADWYDSVVGGNAMTDHTPSNIRGRIYRVAPKGVGWSVPAFDLSSATGCVEALKSPNIARRFEAWTELRKMRRRAEPALRELWNGTNPRYRARALHLLARLEKRGWDYIEEALQDPNSDIRVTGLRIAHEEGIDVIPFVKMVLADDSPQVRREAAILLRHNDSEKAPYYWAELAALHTGKDRWYLEALGIGADGQWERYFPAWLARVGKGWDTPAGHDIVWRARGPQVPVYLVEIIKQTGHDYEHCARFLRSLQFQPQKERNQALVTLLKEVKNHLGESNGWGRVGIDLVTRFEPSPYTEKDLDPDLGRWLATTARKSPQLVQVIQTFGLKDLYPLLLDYASETDETESVAPALQPLVLEDQQKTLMQAFLSEDVTRSVTLAKRLGSVENRRAVQLLSSMVTNSTWPTPLRSAALTGLTLSRRGAAHILELAKEGELPSEFTTIAAIKLNSVPGNWKEIRSQLTKVLPLPSNEEGEVFPPYPELMKMEGHPEHGKEVFKKICMVCHRVRGEGTEFGPDLSQIGEKYGKDALYENILNPNSAISFGYEPYTLILGDEDEEYGFIVEENEQEIGLKIQEGRILRFPKNEIQEIRKEKLSAMPVGLEKGMTTQDLVDLLDFLTTLRG